MAHLMPARAMAKLPAGQVRKRSHVVEGRKCSRCHLLRQLAGLTASFEQMADDGKVYSGTPGTRASRYITGVGEPTTSRLPRPPSRHALTHADREVVSLIARQVHKYEVVEQRAPSRARS